MSEILVFKTQLNPTTTQRKQLAGTAGAARHAYNCLLAWTLEQYELYTQGKRPDKPSLTHQSLQKIWTNKLRNTYAKNWWQDYDSRAFRSGAEQLAKAYKNWFRNGAKTLKGHPQWKNKHKGNDSYTTDCCKLDEKGLTVRLTKIGVVKLHERLKAAAWLQKCGATLQAATISNDATGNWFISLRYRADKKIALQFYKGKYTRKGSGFVGIDLGIKEYATLSDGHIVHNPRILKKREKKLAREQRKLAHKLEARKDANGRVAKPTTASYHRQKQAVARQYKKVRNSREDFTSKLAQNLVANYSTIVVESLSISDLLESKKLSKEIADASWGSFLRKINYMGKRYGTTVLCAPRFFPSSKACSDCGNVKAKLSLSERTYKCSSCGFKLDRDLNAARNLEKWGLDFLALKTIKDAARCDESLNGGSAKGIDPEDNTKASPLEYSGARLHKKVNSTFKNSPHLTMVK